MKKQTLHTIVWKENKLFIARFVEFELASQGKTKEEAITNLKEALTLYLEDEKVAGLRFPSVEEVTTQTISI